MATPAEDRWPYPVARCPTCGRGCCTREELVVHLFERRHWSRLPAVDPAQSQQLRAALEAVEARRRAGTKSDTVSHLPQEDGRETRSA